MNSKLNLISISDIHLGHRKTPTSHIIANLRKTFADSERLEDIDAIFIVGDLFDGPLQFYSEDAVEIQLWLFEFLTICAKRNIVVRILEGTRSHDWKQGIWSTVVKTIGNIPVDLRWIPTLSIEHIDALDIDVLYVPDEWRPETDQTWLEVCQLLKTHQLEQVDFTLLHGAFDKQMPAYVDCPKHNADRYASITRRHVFAGHIHNSWVYKNILGNGSFDRLAHGEEGQKGCWYARYRDSHSEIKFLENKQAMAYLTIDCEKIPIDQALSKIRCAIRSLPDGSHVRIQATNEDPILHSMDVLKKEYRQYQWTSKTSDSKAVQAKLLVDYRPVSKHVPISPENIGQLLIERLQVNAVTPADIDQCKIALTSLSITD